MFFTPYFGGCKYTNKFLFINKNIVFQCFGLLITSLADAHFPVTTQTKPPETLRRGLDASADNMAECQAARELCQFCGERLIKYRLVGYYGKFPYI